MSVWLVGRSVAEGGWDSYGLWWGGGGGMCLSVWLVGQRAASGVVHSCRHMYRATVKSSTPHVGQTQPSKQQPTKPTHLPPLTELPIVRRINKSYMYFLTV